MLFVRGVCNTSVSQGLEATSDPVVAMIHRLRSLGCVYDKGSESDALALIY